MVVCWGRLWQILFSFASSFTPDDNWFKLLLFICNISPFKKMPKHQNRQRRLIFFFLADCFWPIWTIFFQALNCLEVEIGALSLHNESQEGSVQLLWVAWNVVFSQSRPGVTTNCHGLNTVKHVCHAGCNTQGDALSNRFFFFLICMLFIVYERSKIYCSLNYPK